MAKKRRSKRSASVSGRNVTSPGKVTLVTRKFALFLFLTLVSFSLYQLLSNELLTNFFGLLTIILGFLSFAFLIIMILLSILKAGKR